MARQYKKSSNYNQELMDTVREYYLSCEVEPTLEAMSKDSERLFGQFIPYETLKDWKRDDRGGDWSHTWQLFHPSSVEDELDNVRKRIYQIVVDPMTPAAVVSSAVKAYLDLSTKHNPGGKSAKTSPDRADQILKEAISELKAAGFNVGRPQLDRGTN